VDADTMHIFNVERPALVEIVPQHPPSNPSSNYDVRE
jgi:hypothetical protein